MRRSIARLGILIAGLVAGAVQAGPDAFTPGPLVEGFGPIAAVDGAAALPRDAVFKVAFDVSEPAAEGAVSRRLESAARFLNMHAAAGVPAGNMQLAIVVHGRAAFDLVTEARRGEPNASSGLIGALVAAGVSIELCGQTAAYYDIAAGDLLPGVRMALSAMTSHALLQQRGYTLNPF